MITNISYNVLIERFRAFAEGHFLIKGFTHGDPSNVNIEKGVEFPWMHVFPVEVAPQSGSRLYSFIITFADLPRDKETPPEYQREMLSDCIRLAEDLLAEIQNGLTLFGPNVEIDGGANIECFINEFSHTLTGVNLSLTLSVPWNWSACDIPADWSVGGSDSGGTGGGNLGVILETNGVLNGDQTLLNLQQGTNVTIVDNGNGTITINSIGDGTGTVTSVALTMPSGFIVSGSPITTAGTLAITGAGTSSDYIDGTGAVQPFPTITPQVNADWNSTSGVSEILNKPALATVATSGDYNDLSNLPTIPAAQIQSDWNQSNSSALDFIKNKPAIGTGSVTSVAIQLPAPVNPALSVSGSPITSSGTFVISANGTIAQYIDGTGALRTFPAIPKTLTDIIGSGTKVGDLIQWNGTAWAIIGGLSLDALNNVNAPSPTNGQVLAYDTASAQWIPITPASGGTVTSVGLSLPAPVNPAFSVSGSPVTNSGTLAISANGTSSQYVDGTGALQTMPTGLPPTGIAGGDLNGTYPNPTVDGIHGIDMQSGTPNTNDVWVYGGSPAKWQHQHVNAGIVDNDSAVTGTTVKDSLNHLNTTKVESNAAITAGTATKITYDAKGLVTAGTTLAATDIPSGIDATKIGTGVVSNTEFGYLDGVTSAIQTQIDSKQATLVSGTTIKTLEGQSLLGSGNIDLTKSDVGLANVDNTSDLNKPISTATQTALNAKQDTLVSGTNIKTVNSNSLLGSGNVSVGTVTSVGGTGTVAGVTLTGTVTGSGNLTLGGTLAVPIANITATGTPSATTFLRGDGSWATPSGSVSNSAYAANPNTSQAAGSTQFWAITGNAAPNATEGTRQVPMPIAGTLKNLYIRLAAAQSSGGTLVFTLRKNGVSTGITVTFANADGSNVTKSDTTNTVSVVAGDLISLQAVNNAGASASGTIVSISLLLQS